MTSKKPTRTVLRAKDVQLRGKAATETKRLQAEMDKHRAGYVAYQVARAAGTDREAHRPAYTAYKRAYSALLKLRHAAAAKAANS
jgi:hypothetical protein